jgi:hypothetical protein
MRLVTATRKIVSLYDVFIYIVVFAVLVLILATPYVLAVLSLFIIILYFLFITRTADFIPLQSEFVRIRSSGRSPPSL